MARMVNHPVPYAYPRPERTLQLDKRGLLRGTQKEVEANETQCVCIKKLLVLMYLMANHVQLPECLSVSLILLSCPSCLSSQREREDRHISHQGNALTPRSSNQRLLVISDTRRGF